MAAGTCSSVADADGGTPYVVSRPMLASRRSASGLVLTTACVRATRARAKVRTTMTRALALLCLL